MPDPAFIEALKDLGFGGLTAFALIGSFRGWFVWRREHDALKADLAFWKGVAMESMGTAGKAVEVTEKLAKRG